MNKEQIYNKAKSTYKEAERIAKEQKEYLEMMEEITLQKLIDRINFYLCSENKNWWKFISQDEIREIASEAYFA